MNLKIVVGIVLFFLGLGAGVWEWIIAGFTTPLPVVGLILSAIGLYLIISGARAKKGVSALEAVSTPVAAVVGFALGTIAYKELMKYFERRGAEQQLTLSQVEEIDRKIDELYYQGRLDPERYRKAKELVAQLRAKAAR